MTTPEFPEKAAPEKIPFKEAFKRHAKKGFYLYLPPVQAIIFFIVLWIKHY